MSGDEVIVHPDGEVLAEATAARLLTRVVDAQAARGVASVVLTGGRTGIGVLERVRDSAARSAVDWSAVNLFWGDERFLPDGDGERNETQARRALLDHLPLDPERVHPMAPSDGRFGADAEAAAGHYAEVLRTLAGADSDTGVPHFDVLMLGVGEEGHTASLFPDTPYVREDERTVVGVRDCPKPPPTRISLTLPAIAAASEVWLMTTGSGKAEAVSRALAGAAPVDIPAAGARGRDRTLWLLDRDAAKGAAVAD
ncbi:6-phosphogluconolactonase [Actinopolyspora erythraea]|uniref:6-phosphogluconolactonase n=1 Tax=Actinopolyspora erythraea TaxID=414996 RepID=A0A099D3S5_9ACTN|nr:6-phosphogluconolactonase [Actinopolyspora erythraea]ASU79302.1 6-phosphogluconolactonase [Actinopolyspora erythraea]KGI80714.1 6-phosphogluconolactonase [Actinopolyspora erythraea]